VADVEVESTGAEVDSAGAGAAPVEAAGARGEHDAASHSEPASARFSIEPLNGFNMLPSLSQNGRLRPR